jgi:hypothetical protein
LQIKLLETEEDRPQPPSIAEGNNIGAKHIYNGGSLIN